MPTPVLPTTGTASYSLIGASRPTYVDGSTSPGTFSGSISVRAGADGPNFHAISGNFTAAMPDRTYNWSASGGTTSAFFSMFSSGGNISGCANPSNCNAQVTGFFAGANADRAG